MFLDLTVRGPGGDRDVRLETPDGARIRDVRALLAGVAGRPPGSALHVAGRALTDDDPLGGTGVRAGAVVEVGVVPSPPPPSSYALRVAAGPAAGREHVLRLGHLELGREAGCDVALGDERVSRRHAALDVTPSGIVVRDHGSTNGSTVDDEPVTATGTALVPGAVLRLGDSLLTVTSPAVGVATVRPAGASLAVHRRAAPPRPEPVVVTVPAEPDRPRPHPTQWLAALLPALAAGGVAWLLHSPVFLVFAALSPVLLVSTAAGDRWQGRRARRVAARHLARQRALAAGLLARALADETARRRAEAPDPATVALTAAVPGAALWGRRPGDPAALHVRVGCGPSPSRVRVREGGGERPAAVLASVPVTVDVRGGVGVAGDPDRVAAAARWWVVQLAVHHSPAHLRILVLDARPGWRWARWLPHARLAGTRAERTRMLADLEVEIGRRERLVAAGHPLDEPVTVVVAEAGTGGAALLDRGRAVGVAALHTAATADELPAGATVVTVTADGSARVRRRPADGADGTSGVGGVDGDCGTSGKAGAEGAAVADGVSLAWADAVARHLAGLTDAEADAGAAGLPTTATLTGPLGLGAAAVTDVLAAWARDTGRAETVLGVGSGGEPAVGLDLDRDGPHVLVAGTTGSGKSELLRTLVLGLCLRQPPDALAVLLVDYKGGAAFAECAALPHCVGLVTDLDAHLTGRALQSLEAEIRRRERLLRAAGVSDLAAYRAAGRGEPLARLVLVVDEFAALADELPDFVPGLVGVAQRGRSLGLHLVLATQRPGSVVSAEIRANTAARIALRVTEAAESLDVVGTDDAAAFPPSAPGRAVLRTGSGTRVFQTARAARTPAARAGSRVVALDEWRRPAAGPVIGRTALADLVDVVARAATADRRAAPASPWRAPLPGTVALTDLPSAGPGEVPFALADRPHEQAYGTLGLALDPPSSALVVGGPRSGRTTALAVLALGAAARHAPEALEVHVVDPGGDLLALLDGLPHLGSVLRPADAGLTPTLLDRLAVAPAGRVHLLLVDGWDRVRTVLGDDAALTADDGLLALIRAPGSVGVAVTGDRGLLVPRLSSAFGHRLLLRPTDPADAGAWGLAPGRLPRRMPAGRGVRAADGVEFQIAVPQAHGDEAQADALRRQVCTVAAGVPPRGTGGLVVRALPAEVTLAELPADGTAAPRVRLGRGGDAAAPLTLDPTAGPRRWLVAGPPRSGRSTALVTVLHEAHRTDLPAVVAASGRSPLAAAAAQLGWVVLDPADPADAVGTALDAATAGRHQPALLLVDDADAFADTDAGDALAAAARDHRHALAVVLSGRPDDLALAYRGLAAEVRRSRSGLALRPGPVDGELFGVALPRCRPGDPPGRGWLVSDPAWAVGGRPAAPLVPVQVARPVAPSLDDPDPACGPAQSMWGYR